MSKFTTTDDILRQWAKYSEFDENNKPKNLLSVEYDMYQANCRLKAINEKYDPSGVIGVLYAKHTFCTIMKKLNISVMDVLSKSVDLDEELAMWEVFNSSTVKLIEESFISQLLSFASNASDVKLLGNSNLLESVETLLECIDTVVKELDQCNEDLFLLGSTFNPVHTISSHIHVYNTLSECLLQLEKSDDGIYLCYVTDNDTAGGYFGFYLKSSGNLISVNERVNESYRGQHNNSRNGRWSEDKKYSLFPYNYIFDFSDHDYKGYAQIHSIDRSQLDIFKLPPDGYVPILISAMLLHKRYSNKDLSDRPLKYVDRLVNIDKFPESASNELMCINPDSMILKAHSSLDLGLCSDNIVDGSASIRFDWKRNKNLHWSESGGFPENTFLAKTYGYDIQLPELDTLLHPTSKLIGDGTHVSEFVGTSDRLAMQAYMDSRELVAEKIRERMYEEFLAAGGYDGVMSWFKAAINDSKDKAIDILVDKHIDILSGGSNCSGCGQSTEPGLLNSVSIVYDTYPKGFYISESNILNESNGKYGSEHAYICPISGNTANVFCVFRFRNQSDMEEFFDCNLPKILIGYNSRGHDSSVNTILDAHDPVERVGTPFEQDEINRNPRYAHLRYIGRDPFSFAIGISKRTLNKLVNEKKSKQDK